MVRAEPPQEADRGRRAVELREAVFLDGLPVARGRRVDGGRFEDGGGDAVEERPVDDVAKGAGRESASGQSQGQVERTYVCPVIQPMSAMQANLSSGCTSKTYLTVSAAPRRYPPVVCTTPLGLPVEPEVCRD